MVFTAGKPYHDRIPSIVKWEESKVGDNMSGVAVVLALIGLAKTIVSLIAQSNRRKAHKRAKIANKPSV